MPLVVTALLTGCLVNETLYLERLAALRDADADGWTTAAGDCDDADADRNPGAEDDCDGIDDDCDGQVDEDASVRTWYLDADQDGFGSAPTEACAAPENHAGTDGDCDDNDSGVHPGAPEAWEDDGVDNDCDGESLEQVTWNATEATTRIDGTEAGGELGRRLLAWAEGECLFVTAPYADEARGAVYAVRYGPGIEDVGEAAALGPETGAFLTAATLFAEHVVLSSVAFDGGRGAVWLVDAGELCSSGADVALAPAILGAAEGDLFGANVVALPDIDGDGTPELAVSAQGHDGAHLDGGAIAIFLDTTGVAGFADADVVVTGGYAGAALEEVAYAAGPGGGWLLFARTATGAGGTALLRVPADALASGDVELLADGALSTTATAVRPTVVGDLDFDGADEVVLGSASWAMWSVAALSGVVDEAAGGAPLVAGEEDEWLTGFTPLGDIDGGGRPDLLLQADDWPAGGSRGRLAILPGEDFLAAQSNELATQRRIATGAELGDAFGYRAAPAGDFDGDGTPDIVVSGYGSDAEAPSAGSVYVLPVPSRGE